MANISIKVCILYKKTIDRFIESLQGLKKQYHKDCYNINNKKLLKIKGI